MTPRPRLLTLLAALPGADPALARLGLDAPVLRLRRAWPRSGSRLTLEYLAGDVVVAGQWFADPREARNLAAALRERATGTVALVLPAGEAVVLQAHGADRRLRALAAALADPDARLLAHRAERRATVATPGMFLKVVAPGAAAGIAAAHWLARSSPAEVAVPPVLGSDGGSGVVRLGAVPGRSLHDLLDGPGAEAAVHGVGAALRRFHEGLRPTPAEEGHGPRAEAAVLRRWLDRLAPFDRALHARVATEAVPVLAALESLPPIPATGIHGDLHDKQVFVEEGGGVGLIDLDTLRRGDPAIDLANLAAHLELRMRQAGRLPVEAAGLRSALLDGYATPAGWRDRLLAYERATRLRLACVYAFRPRWGALAAELAGLPPGTADATVSPG